MADSGLAGTMMLQLTLAAAAGALPVADPLGHGVADAVLVGDAEPEAAVVGAAEPDAAVVGAAEPDAAVVAAAEPDAAVVGFAEPEAAVVGAVVAVAVPAVLGAADAADEVQLASAESLSRDVKP